MKHKIAIAVPVWGNQSPDFWQPAIVEATKLHKFNIEVADVLISRSMSVDNNRNEIVKQFKKLKADWLVFIDADNANPVTWIPRLLETATAGDRLMVGGIYFRRDMDRPTPIAYFRQDDGRYQTIPGYTRGSIIPVDAGGMNATVIHRSVFDQIEKNYLQLITDWGARWVVHVDDVEGMILDDATAPDDNKVVDGQLRVRLREMPHNPDGPDTFPFFRQEFNRTEDMPFFENAQRVGIQHWIDTSVECYHLAEVGIGSDHYLDWIKKQIEKGEWDNE